MAIGAALALAPRSAGQRLALECPYEALTMNYGLEPASHTGNPAAASDRLHADKQLRRPPTLLEI